MPALFGDAGTREKQNTASKKSITCTQLEQAIAIA